MFVGRKPEAVAIVGALLSLFLGPVVVSGGPAPFGGSVMINGRSGPGEWSDSTCQIHSWENGVELRLKQDSGYVYFRISDSDTTHTGIDLYVDNKAGDVRLLHVSSALGERRLQDSIWSDFVWGGNDQWNANYLQAIYVDGQTSYLTPECFEFQVSKQWLTGAAFRLMVHLKRPEKQVPVDASNMSPANWTELRLR